MPAAAPPLVLIDRDGVINRDSDEYIKSVAEWHPLPGSLEAIAALRAAGFRVAVVTNQSGVGRGLLSLETLESIHAAMRERVAAAGGEIAAIFYCPHRPDEGCACRKPKPGLLRRAAAHFGCELRGVPFIGDKASDVEAARAVGARPILVGTAEIAAAAGLARKSGTARTGGTAGTAEDTGDAVSAEATQTAGDAGSVAGPERYADLAAAAAALIAESTGRA